MKRILALFLCLLLLTGCSSGIGITKFKDMTYQRPDMAALEKCCQDACALGAEGGDADEVLEAVWDYYDAYDEFNTAYDLAYIHHHGDMTDDYWQTEHDFCAENVALADMYLEDLYTALAQSPLRTELEEEYFGEGFFLDYDGEGWYDDTLLDLLDREQELIAKYYALCDSTDLEPETGPWYDQVAVPLADLLARLTLLRQEMADHLGYDSYTDLAWECYHLRDYTPAQASAYLDEIRTELVSVYEKMNAADPWAVGWEECSEREVFRYVKEAAEQLGGEADAAFRVLEQGGHYDISASDNKSGLSFELFLQSYYHPFVFVSGTGTRYDCLTFAHEFGHAAMDYAAFGTTAGTDVAEIFSQGMEYLSLSDDLVELKLADSLSIYVEQGAYAAFELAMYELPPEEITGENLLALYEEIGTAYGFESWDWDSRDLVTIPHFYEYPMYVISYVVSNDAAMQLYQLELQTPGSGAAVYLDQLATDEQTLLTFLAQAGLHSPFGRTKEVRAIMEAHFG